MARTFISQPDQVFASENFNDALAAGSTLQSTSTTLESDLNAVRSQIRRILWAGVSGSWYDAVTAPSGSNSARGLNTLNNDLTDLEQKRFLFRRQNLNLVNVATGSNFALLSTSLGTAPLNFAVVGHPVLSISTATGSIVALLSGSEGTYGSHSVAQVSGSSVITPRNLVIIRDAWSGQQVTASGGRDVYGLLQAESGTLTGDAFNDASRRTQISFVYEVTANGTSSLAAAQTANVGGRTIEYSYVRRTALDDIPEDAYLSNTIFMDMPEGGTAGGAQLTDITLQRAITNQAGTVTQAQNIAIAINAGFSWAFLSASQTLWSLAASNTGNTYTINVDRFSISSSFPSTFTKGLQISTGSTEIDVGVTAGTINTLTGTALTLRAGAFMQFTDGAAPFSTYSGSLPIASGVLEWNNFGADFGNTTTILGALHTVSQSLSGSLRRRRYTAGVTTSISADTNVTSPTNLDAALGSYVGRDFIKDMNVYLNGILLLPGQNSGSPNDVYPGTTISTGDLKFPYALRSGSQITMELF